MNLIELLDVAKERTGSDPKTAEQIGISKGAMSEIRKGDRALPIDAAVELGRIVGKEWSVVVAAAEAHRRRKRGDTEGASRWARRSAVASSVGALLIIGAMLMPPRADAAQINELARTFHDIHYGL